MKKLKVYLDTSVINFLFADDAPEFKEKTIEFFEKHVKKEKFDTYVSDIMIQELERTKDPNKRQKTFRCC